jgi:hypothetical protein
LKTKSVGFQSWENFFEYLTRDVALEPNLHERVAEGSKRNLLQLWMQNYADNFINIRYGDEASANIPEDYQQHSIIDVVTPEPAVEGTQLYSTTEESNVISWDIVEGMKIKNPPGGSAIVVGRGPSLFQYGHLKLLADAMKDGEYTGMVIASDGALIPCLEANVLPDAVVTVDGSPIIKKYFDHHLVKTFGSQIKWITCVTAHRNTYLAARSAGMNATWFMPQFDDDRQNESWTRLQRLQSASKKFPLGVPAMNTGGNCLTEDSIIMSPNKTFAIKDAIVGETVYSSNNGLTLEESTITDFIPQGEAEVFELRTNTRSIKATARHKFLTLIKNDIDRYYHLEWISLENLKVGEYIVIQTKNTMAYRCTFSVKY